MISLSQTHPQTFYSAAPRGGTELMHELLKRYVDPQLLDRVYLSVSAITNHPTKDKPNIFWAHQSYDQPSVQNLQSAVIRDGVDLFVFVSEWQRTEYVRQFKIDSAKTTIIRNAIEPLTPLPKPVGRLQVVYTATPFRGLDVLLTAVERLGRTDFDLHIYSGMSLYGRPHEDRQYQPLYERAAALTNVHYHGVVDNKAVRDKLVQSHIFAYPATWEETSCVALIEALSAGCYALFPSLAALPETASGFGRSYPFIPHKVEHAERFASLLDQTLDTYWLQSVQQQLASQTAFMRKHYTWPARAREWEKLLRHELKNHGAV